MPHAFPAAATRHPITLPDGTVHTDTVFLNAVIDHPNIEIGDYSYMSRPGGCSDWAALLAPFLYPGAPERLRIGRFCQIAQGATCVTSSANHRYDGISSFPFPIFTPDRMAEYAGAAPTGADTVIGHDCWIGTGATILPGARIGNGAILGAQAVVGGEVPDYAIVVGNPGRVLRLRFPKADVARLLRVAWWDWPTDVIVARQQEIMDADISALEAFG
ncbi:CatB-related O-acetyltransferase [Anianabacter salinae]|uniref:CatB-related O-acetyltransferase n=1 Tax=Anianabacter salinae TaxID=2851023 RepID=UPI00225E108B|nr:CatB-related O-acetyltransferase [Anianabacter salinae]MBV0913173.1 CatB-related O-acetyltransferase [Anianabacter salinae]